MFYRRQKELIEERRSVIHFSRTSFEDEKGQERKRREEREGKRNKKATDSEREEKKKRTLNDRMNEESGFPFFFIHLTPSFFLSLLVSFHLFPSLASLPKKKKREKEKQERTK